VGQYDRVWKTGGERHIPSFLDRAFEDVARGVDEDVEAADFGVEVCYYGVKLLEIVGDVEVCGDGAFALEVLEFGGVASCGDDGEASGECFESDAFAKAAGGSGDEPDGSHSSCQDY
jgi:hypothetical protein